MRTQNTDQEKEQAFDLLKRAARQLYKGMCLADQYSSIEYMPMRELRSEILEHCFIHRQTNLLELTSTK